MDYSTLAAVLVGGLLAFGGVVYAEWRHDRREQRSKDRLDMRDSLRELKAAILELEDAGSELLVAQSAEWNGQPLGQRMWSEDRTTDEWTLFARWLRQVTALRSELVDDALREKIEAYQEETGKLLRTGPAGPSDADVAAFKVRAAARVQSTESVIEDVGAAYRNLK